LYGNSAGNSVGNGAVGMGGGANNGIAVGNGTSVSNGSSAGMGNNTAPTRASDFFGDVSGKAYVYSKDIREVVLETNQSTMLTRPSGTGSLQFDVKVTHRN
jgi:hypothetical protein